MARPSSYSDEIALEIAARSTEGRSLRTICDDEDMPCLRTVLRWRNEHPEFDRMLNAAHLDRATIYFEDSIDIADEPVEDSAQASRARNRIQARQWAAARLNPAKYSERIVNSHVIPATPDRPFGEMTGKEQLDMARQVAFALHLGMRVAKKQREVRQITGDLDVQS